MSESSAMALLLHVQWLVEHRGQALQGELRQRENLEISALEAVGYFSAADPSPQKHATQWLVDTWLARGYLWEDLAGGADSKVAETLSLFAQHRGALPRGVRNLEDHADLAGVWGAIKNLVAIPGADLGGGVDHSPTGRALRRLERARARAESIILHESPELRLVVPTTQSAAQWWGRGTRWCTSALNNNMFERYNNQAPLVIAVLPTTRYQMWLDPDSNMQFMDEADAQVDATGIASDQEVLQPLLEWAFARGCRKTLGMMARDKRTPEMCRQAVEHDGIALGDVPTELRTPELSGLAVAFDPHALRYVPGEHIDADMAMDAVSRLGRALAYVPQHLRNRDMYLAAIRQSERCFDQVPEGMVDHEFCLRAFELNAHCINVMPQHMVSETMYRRAVETCPKYIRWDLIDAPDLWLELALRAVQAEKTMLSVLSRYTLTDAVRLAALDAWPDTLPWVVDRLKTPERCRAAVRADGACLWAVPRHLVDQDMCWDAVRSNPQSLFNVPEEYKTPQLCTYAIMADKPGTKQSSESRSGLLRYVPEHYKTEELCMMAVQKNGHSLDAVPMFVRNRHIYMAAVTSAPLSVFSIPDCARTQKIMDVVAESIPALANITAPSYLLHLYPGTESTQPWTRDCLDDLVARVEAWAADRMGAQGLADNIGLPAPGSAT